MNNCIEKCLMQRLKDEKLYCRFYQCFLEFSINDGKLIAEQCKECKEEMIIGSGTIEEELVKTTKCINIIMHEFEKFSNELMEKVTYIKTNMDNIKKHIEKRSKK